MLAAARRDLRPASYLDMMEALDEALARGFRGKASPLFRRYLDHLIPALSAWLTALR